MQSSTILAEITKLKKETLQFLCRHACTFAGWGIVELECDYFMKGMISGSVMLFCPVFFFLLGS